MLQTLIGARPTAPLAASLVERLGAALDEPEWLSDLRKRWWDRYEATPFPTGQEEEWRRTSLKGLPLGVDALVPSSPASASRDVALPAEWVSSADSAPGSLLHVDASPARHRLALHLAEAGVVFTDLASAARTHPDRVRAYLGTAESLPSHAKFWALANAAWAGGTFLHVPAGVEIDEPLFAGTLLTRTDVAHFPQTLVVAGPNSRVTLVEDFVTPDRSVSGTDEGWLAGATDIRAGDGARVGYVNLQRLGRSTWNLGFQRADVGPNAELRWLNVEVGSKVSKLGLEAAMTGKGGTSELLGLIAAGDEQRIDINSVQDLAASHTRSELLYLSALYDRAKASFYGLLRVRAGTAQTSSYQECRNLLLSPHAGAEPIPALEILSNDLLRCGHGATAGAIDPIQLFYAQSRGLDPETAERMIVRGFFEQVLSRLHQPSVKERMLAALAPRIGPSDPGDPGDEVEVAA